jgi:hypothetical protein
MPKISVMRLEDDFNSGGHPHGNRTAYGSSANSMSYDDGSSSRVRSCSSLSYGRYEGVPGILIGTLGAEEEE